MVQVFGNFDQRFLGEKRRRLLRSCSTDILYFCGSNEGTFDLKCNIDSFGGRLGGGGCVYQAIGQVKVHFNHSPS